MREQIYTKDSDDYFKNSRKVLLDLIPDKLKNGNLLEIGAGAGNTLVYAKKHSYAASVYGIELCQVDNSFQNSNEIDNFIIGNIEEMDLPYEDSFFDVIICADVLEHLVNPYDIVKKMKRYLKDDGVFIASIPNIREISVMRDIFFKGNFKYADSGILDSTHLRFFCKKNMVNLFESNGYNIDIFSSVLFLYNSKRKFLNQITLYAIEEFLSVQYYILAKKK